MRSTSCPGSRIACSDQREDQSRARSGWRCQGIGKDTLLWPVRYAIGEWNFADVTPLQLLGRFNGFVKSVILRVSEVRDLGDFDRYAFYEHIKVYAAAPPEVLRCDEKNIREYAVPNVCGVIMTTNYKQDGIYLPADDRRHYVAWSELSQQDFTAEYWTSAVQVVRSRRQRQRRRLPGDCRSDRLRRQSTTAEDGRLLRHRRRQPCPRGRRARRRPGRAGRTPSAITLRRLLDGVLRR